MKRIDKSNSEQTFKELSIELTHRCPLNCIYCSSNADIAKDEFIDLDRLLEIILEVKDKFGVNVISLSGGETFLYPRFSELYKFLANKNFKILIYTSGIILNQDGIRVPLSTDFLQKLRLQKDNPKLFLNVQGRDKESIEKINGVSGSYELIKQSIDHILSAGLYLGAHIVPFKANYKFLPEIVDYCRNKSFNEVSFLRFVPQGRGLDRDLFNTRAEFAYINESVKSILQRNQSEKIKIDIRLGHPINFLFLTGSEKLYGKEETHYCRGGLDAPLILPSGDVSMCPAWKNLREFSVGNIYQQNFEEIWGAHYFNVFRDFIKQGYKLIREPCRSCKHLESCRGKCVAQRLLAHKHIGEDTTLEELLLLAPDPQCFKQLVGR